MSIQNNLRSVFIVASIVSSLLASAGCNRDTQGNGESASVLTDAKLVDQNGNAVALSSLKGKPLVVDFIYTSCPGPCLMETAKLANVALRLGNDLGSKVTIVSISVDPEHDGPKQLLDYSRQQGADEKGWYFLTGGPAEVDQALSGFKLSRQVEPDGSVGHLVDMMLIGPDGRLVREYNGEVVRAQDIVDDIKKTLNKGGAA
ncbi:MAG TPA: SCO family protein [Candidatus Binatus sp.]|uniref:SCO family protein n=1 Tax=Candidatus Binatus sp. TaxID=2811406 RepID=UPI002F40C1A4